MLTSIQFEKACKGKDWIRSFPTRLDCSYSEGEIRKLTKISVQIEGNSI